MLIVFVTCFNNEGVASPVDSATIVVKFVAIDICLPEWILFCRSYEWSKNQYQYVYPNSCNNHRKRNWRRLYRTLVNSSKFNTIFGDPFNVSFSASFICMVSSSSFLNFESISTQLQSYNEKCIKSFYKKFIFYFFQV